jgi:hypothetical protein
VLVGVGVLAGLVIGPPRIVLDRVPVLAEFGMLVGAVAFIAVVFGLTTIASVVGTADTPDVVLIRLTAIPAFLVAAFVLGYAMTLRRGRRLPGGAAPGGAGERGTVRPDPVYVFLALMLLGFSLVQLRGLLPLIFFGHH